MMGWPEAFTVVAIISVGAWLARRASIGARIALWASALLVSAGLFLPSSTLRALVGPEALPMLASGAAALHGSIESLAHFTLFVWLGLVLWTLRPDLRGRGAVAALMILAIASELLQGLTVERSPRLDDVGVNLLGAGTGLLLAVIAVAFRKRVRSTP